MYIPSSKYPLTSHHFNSLQFIVSGWADRDEYITNIMIIIMNYYFVLSHRISLHAKFLYFRWCCTVHTRAHQPNQTKSNQTHMISRKLVPNSMYWVSVLFLLFPKIEVMSMRN